MADETGGRLPSVRSGLSEPSTRRRLLNALRSSLRTFQDQRRELEVLNDEVAAMNMEQRNVPAQHRESRQRLNTVNERMRQFDRRRPYLEALLSEEPDTSQGPILPPAGLSPSDLVRTRRRAFRPSERLTRSMRQRLASTTDSIIPSPSSSSVPPLPRPLSPRPRSDSAQRDYADSSYDRDARNRAKRRKLDDGSYDDQPKALTYGHKGQVVPGHLRLEVVSCNGGEYVDPQMPVNSWPQTVLEDNLSVYCANSNRCNMLFKHSSGMPFALTKIIIKAPHAGYDTLVREGMVFVAMDDDSLVEKTAKYEMYYSSQAHRYHRQRPDLRPSQEWSNATRSPLRSADRSHYLRDPAPSRQHVDSDPFLASAVVPGFAVTTGDPSDDDEVLSRSRPPSPRPWHEPDVEYSYTTYTDRYRPVYVDEEGPRARYDYLSGPSSDSEAEDSTLLDELLHRTRHRSHDPGTNVPPVVGFGRRLTSEDDRSGASIQSRSATIGGASDPPGYERLSSAEPESSSRSTKARDEALAEARRVAAVDGHDTLAPHARFSIPRHRDGVAVSFDPPVAGRYILVKLWTACPNALIDIKNIAAYGYGGPRYFPSTGL
ncbi:hypothetical protein DV736_g6513, partial [Chaetothyriales sp. CBS 134916]